MIAYFSKIECVSGSPSISSGFSSMGELALNMYNQIKQLNLPDGLISLFVDS